jgi:hypothetical protein
MMRARFFAHPIMRIVIGITVVMAATFITLAVVDSLVPKPLRVAWPMPLAALTGVLGYRLFFSRVEKRAITELALPGAAREAATGIALGAALGLLVASVLAIAGAFGACYMLTRRLWLSMGVHLGWNYLYDGLFAVPVSGHAARGWLQVTMPGPDWLTGGSYGVEASVVTLVVWGAVAILLLRRVPK